MFSTVGGFTEFEDYVRDSFSLRDGSFRMLATTKPSLGSLSPLKSWDLKCGVLDSLSWEAVIGVAGIQGWLGVTVKII